MKPVRLEFCGVNSFSERAEIDFTSLLEYGIFGIFGDTGSGKSTILDCICFALYGKVSRFDAKEAVIVNLINYHSDRAYVNFEFEIYYDGKRRTYRVERELKRKNGTQNVRLYEKTEEGAYSAIAEGVRDGNAAIEKIIGLEQKDFEKCIALPQGEFAQFVKSQKSDRLKLISRLFNLESYGEGLSRRITVRYSDVKAQADVLKARLEPYESVTEEAIKDYKSKLAALKAGEKQSEAVLEKAREQEKRIASLVEKRREAQKTLREMEKLDAIRSEMSALNGELERLEKAAAAVKEARELRAAEEKAKGAELAKTRAAERLLKAQDAVKSVSEWNAEKADEEIVRLTTLVAQAKRAETDRAAWRETERRLNELQTEFAAESECFKGFSYSAEKKAIEAELKSLGGEDFIAYLGDHFDDLFRTEYGRFAADLKKLTEEYPVIAPDAVPMIKKYRNLAAGETKELSDIRAEYDALEARRDAAREKRVQIEKVKGKYDVHLARLQQIETERRQFKARLEELAARTAESCGDAAELEEQLKALRETQKANTAKRERAAEELAAANAETAAAEERFKAAEERREEAVNRLHAACASGGFTGEEQALALIEKYGDPAGAKRRVESYKESYAATRVRCRELAKLDFSEASDEQYEAAVKLLRTAENEVKENAQKRAVLSDALARAERDIELKRTLTKEFTEKRKEAELYERLKKLLEGNKFMEFVAEEYLQTVAANASGRLLSLTDGRYFLRYEGNFIVGDNYNGGAPRGIFTLSGGETFLVSLSLALALGAEICARSLRPIEFFFLDEGFGTLDERLVDTVMDSLEKLKGEHFSIGIISHVEELRHRIERKLYVKKATDSRSSQITME